MKLSMTIAVVLLWASGGTTALESNNVTTYEVQSSKDLQAVSVHSRKKRYIVFPKGSSLQLILELLVHVPTQFEVVVGPTLQVAWPLPSDGHDSIRSKRSFVDARLHANYFQQFFRSVNGCASIGSTTTGKKNRILSDVAALLDLMGMTVGLAWQLPDDPMIYNEFKKKHKIYKRNVFKKMEAFISRPGGANGRQCVLKALCESGQRTPSKKKFLTEILHKIFSVEAEEDSEENHEDKVYRKAHQSVNKNCETLYPECNFSLFNDL